MVMVPQAVPELKRFLQPVGLKDAAQTMLLRVVAAFMLHVGRMTALQAAGTIQTDPCHRAQVCRSLGRRFWAKHDPLEMLCTSLLAMEKKTGRFVFIVDQTLHGQQGQLTENTYSTGNRQRRPRKGVRYSSYKVARKSCHCFVMGLLLTPSGYRIPFYKPFYTREYCRKKKLTFRTQTELGADLIRE